MSTSSTTTSAPSIDFDKQGKILGHPAGLFTLFFAEMWERFSYYGMRALLIFYMIKGFLSYEDNEAYAVYGAYVGLVYATPFIGGILADRLLGARRAVVLGGALMAAGHLLMGLANNIAFFLALALLIVGNGFFKPNISTIVGTLYPERSPDRDGGFTLFYMGINLGAAMSPLLCGYIGETFGWHYGFGLATLGMLIGLAVFVAPRGVAQALIVGGALTAATALFVLPQNIYLFAVMAFVGVALLLAAAIAFTAIQRGGIPEEAGQPPDPAKLTEKSFLGLRNDWTVYLGVAASIPVLALLVSGNRSIRFIPEATVDAIANAFGPVGDVVGTFLGELATPAGLVLILIGVVALTILVRSALSGTKIERHRMWVVLILMFFSMLFWSFFEQAGSSVNNFTDRNVTRTAAAQVVQASDVGQAMTFEPSQAQLGHSWEGEVVLNGKAEPWKGGIFLLGDLDGLRWRSRAEEDEGGGGFSEQLDQTLAKSFLFGGGEDAGEQAALKLVWTIEERHVGMGIEGSEVPASTFQAANPIFILIFAPLFTILWAVTGRAGFEPSTPVKFGLGLLQLGMGFGALWYGAANADELGMVSVGWLLAGYLLHTTGELCLSPVGLSMVTKLSPARIVSTVMGAWFLATAFSGYVAGIIATFTGVSHGGDEGGVPAPIDTVHVYGDVFGTIAIAAGASAFIVLALSPLLKKWMHEGEDDPEAGYKTDPAATPVDDDEIADADTEDTVKIEAEESGSPDETDVSEQQNVEE